MKNEAKSILEAETEIIVPFHDIDLMEVVWHGNYVKYFEIARTALLEKIGYNYRQMRESGFAWPIVELKIRYSQPAHLGQRLNLSAILREYEIRLKIDYLVSDKESGKRLSRGHTIQVAVNLSSQEMQLASPCALTKKIESYNETGVK